MGARTESKLFGFLTLTQRFSDGRIASALHFPDGRTLPFNGCRLRETDAHYHRETTIILISSAQNDPDWRVRFTAYESLERMESESVEAALFEGLSDPHSQVKIAALKTLHGRRYTHSLSRSLAKPLSELLQKTPPTGETMGLFLAAMHTLSVCWTEKSAAAFVPMIREWQQAPDFPFADETIEVLTRLTEFPSRFLDRKVEF